jgi:hypothetical protein
MGCVVSTLLSASGSPGSPGPDTSLTYSTPLHRYGPALSFAATILIGAGLLGCDEYPLILLARPLFSWLMSALIVLLQSVRAVHLDPARLYGISLPPGAEAKLHRMCASKLPPITAPTRAGVRYGAPALPLHALIHPSAWKRNSPKFGTQKNKEAGGPCGPQPTTR